MSDKPLTALEKIAAAEGNRVPTRDQARSRAACALARAREIVDNTTPINADFDATRVRGLIDIATEWRYLAEDM